MGQVWGMRMVVCRAWLMSRAGVCHRYQRSVFGLAPARRVPARQRSWNQRTSASA